MIRDWSPRTSDGASRHQLFARNLKALLLVLATGRPGGSGLYFSNERAGPATWMTLDFIPSLWLLSAPGILGPSMKDCCFQASSDTGFCLSFNWHGRGHEALVAWQVLYSPPPWSQESWGVVTTLTPFYSWVRWSLEGGQLLGLNCNAAEYEVNIWTKAYVMPSPKVDLLWCDSAPGCF